MIKNRRRFKKKGDESMPKRRTSYEQRRRKKLEIQGLNDLISSIKERTEVFTVHLDEVSTGQSDPLFFSEHFDKYIGNMILFNTRIKELLGS